MFSIFKIIYLSKLQKCFIMRIFQICNLMLNIIHFSHVYYLLRTHQTQLFQKNGLQMAKLRNVEDIKSVIDSSTNRPRPNYSLRLHIQHLTPQLFSLFCCDHFSFFCKYSRRSNDLKLGLQYSYRNYTIYPCYPCRIMMICEINHTNTI